MSNIPNELIQSYEPIPMDFFPGNRSTLFAGVADGGNHYLKYGIKEGTQLIFDSKQSFEPGQLSCFVGPENQLQLRRSRKKGYKHLGKLVATFSTFQ